MCIYVYITCDIKLYIYYMHLFIHLFIYVSMFMCTYIYIYIYYILYDTAWYCMYMYIYFREPRLPTKDVLIKFWMESPSPGSPLSWESFPLQPTSSLLLVEETHQTTNKVAPTNPQKFVCNIPYPDCSCFITVFDADTVSNHAFCWWNHRLFWLNYHNSYILLLV